MSRSKDTEMQETLKDIRRKEEENAVLEYKNKLALERQAARAAELDELNRSLVTRRDEKGNPTGTAWDDWMQQVEKSTSEAAAAFNSEWKISMLNLVNSFNLMVHAVDGELERNLRIPLKSAIVDSFFLGTVKDAFIKAPKEITLPSLQHHVNFTDDNKLKIDPLVRSDHVTHNDPNDPLAQKTQDVQNAFEKVVVKWLKDIGYKPHPTEKGQFVNEVTGKTLDKATFNDLKDHPVNGLQNYLADTTDLSFTPGR